MTGEFKDMLHLFECGAKGTAPVSKEYDAAKILVLAKQQGVLEMVLSALIQVGYDFDDLKSALTLGVYQNTQKIHFLHSKVKKLEECGIECCVLKGISYAHMYPNSDLRRSGDVDILINPNDEKKALEILGTEGFSYAKRHSSYNETVCKHKNGGVLEVHISPYDELRDKIMFKGIDLFIEPYRKMNALGCFGITVMGITDGLVFNVLHSIKHFLSSGMGIRQVMDILMYMKYYKDEIDWSRFTQLMEKLKYKTFIDNCIGIGIKYLGFSKDEIPDTQYSDEKVDLLLNDIEAGGLFGYNDYERSKFYSQYISFATSAGSGQNLVGESYLKSNALRKLFPKTIALYIKYPYSYKCKALVPIAWCHRIFDYVFKRQRKTRSIMFEKRMKLLESLDII